jgi:hypothetical protein
MPCLYEHLIGYLHSDSPSFQPKSLIISVGIVILKLFPTFANLTFGSNDNVISLYTYRIYSILAATMYIQR